MEVAEEACGLEKEKSGHEPVPRGDARSADDEEQYAGDESRQSRPPRDPLQPPGQAGHAERCDDEKRDNQKRMHRAVLVVWW